VLSVDEVAAHIEIVRLIHLYAERVDLGDFEGVAELFRHAGMSAEGNDHVDRGYEAVLRRYIDWTRRLEDNKTPHTKHVTTNVILDIDTVKGTAFGRCYFTVFQQTDALPLQPIISGRYHDRFVHGDGAWRFEHRHIVSDLFGDLSQHLLDPTGRGV
jgi:hypothetical protein